MFLGNILVSLSDQLKNHKDVLSNHRVYTLRCMAAVNQTTPHPGKFFSVSYPSNDLCRFILVYLCLCLFYFFLLMIVILLVFYNFFN